jgi:formate hydrogenlyase subunit 6/NADH:ubiquinone oxidoreductase subunit I
MFLAAVPWVEICPSDAISLSEILAFVQVKQNKISCEKFLQIPADFDLSANLRLEYT